MAGLCSRHHPKLGKVEGCVQCHGTMRDLFPMTWSRKSLEASLTGKHKCAYCGFVSYNSWGKTTATRCPKPGCEKEKPMIKLTCPVHGNIDSEWIKVHDTYYCIHCFESFLTSNLVSVIAEECDEYGVLTPRQA